MADDKDLVVAVCKTALELIAEAYDGIDDEQEEQERIVKEEHQKEKTTYYSQAVREQEIDQIGTDNYVYGMLYDLQKANARDLKHMIQSMTSYDYMAFRAYVKPALQRRHAIESDVTASDLMQYLPKGRASLDARQLLAARATPEVIRALIAPAVNEFEASGKASATNYKPLAWMRKDLKCPNCTKFFQRPCRLRQHQQRKHTML
jgi:hypothetical protein